MTFEIDRSTDFASFLSALQACLNEAAIPIVTVTLDDIRYVMEAEAPTRRILNLAPIRRLTHSRRRSPARTAA